MYLRKFFQPPLGNQLPPMHNFLATGLEAGTETEADTETDTDTDFTDLIFLESFTSKINNYYKLWRNIAVGTAFIVGYLLE